MRGLPPSSPFFSKRSELIGLLSPARRRCPGGLSRPSQAEPVPECTCCLVRPVRWPRPASAGLLVRPRPALGGSGLCASDRPAGPSRATSSPRWLLFLAAASPTQVTGAPRWAPGLASELCSLLPRPCPSPYFKHLQVTPSFWKSTRPLSRAPISRFPDSCSHTGNRVGLADLQDKAIVGSTEGALL